jgi:hypothetical protein
MKIHTLFVVPLLGALVACNSVATPMQNVPAVRGNVRSAEGSDLLYVSLDESEVLVFAYHDGVIGQQVGTVENVSFPRGMCTDKEGDVWITDAYQGHITEYEHGGTTPIRTIVENIPNVNDCAVDPVTGNLAVSNSSDDKGAVRIYARRAHRPTVYKLPFFEPTSVAYDSAGNLVVTGGRGELDELPYRGSGFESLGISGGTLNGATGIQWGNPNFLIGVSGSGGAAVDKVKVSKGVAKIVGSLSLTGTIQFLYPALRAGMLVVPDFYSGTVRVYNLTNGKVISSRDTSQRVVSAVVSQPPPK